MNEWDPTDLITDARKLPVSKSNLEFLWFPAGELDPDRMGSGIQYGDPSLRRTIRPGKQEERQKCAC